MREHHKIGAGLTAELELQKHDGSSSVLVTIHKNGREVACSTWESGEWSDPLTERQADEFSEVAWKFANKYAR